MYSECVRCQKLGHECDGPNFVAMPPPELISWCKERKKHMGLTNAKLAELSGLPQGTIQKLLQVLVGGKWLGDPCADPTGSGVAEMKDFIRQLEADIRHKDKTIQDHEAQILSMTTLITNTNARYTKQTEELRAMIKDQNERHTKSQDFLREQIRFRNKVIGVLGTLLGICVVVIIGALIVDRIYPHLGFFWRDLTSLFNGSLLGSPIV